MRLSFLFFIFLGFNKCICQSTIIYSDSLILKTEHFNVTEENIDSKLLNRHGKNLRAYIDVNILDDGRYGLDSAIFNIRAVMNCNNSWLDQNYKNVKGVLRHELYHFKITEIFVREYRKAMIKNQYTFETLYQFSSNLKKEHWDYQEKYDRETEHFGNVEKQKEWEKLIDDKLLELKDYNDITIKVVYLKD